MNPENSAQHSRNEGRASGGRPRRRIRPSRARGLRTRTGCLTCRERRVKCDDGKPTCLRCAKSDRVCRYAEPATQHVDHAQPGSDRGIPGVQADLTEGGGEPSLSRNTIGDSASVTEVTEPVTRNPNVLQANLGNSPAFQATCAALVEDALRPDTTQLAEGSNSHSQSKSPNDQTLPGFDPAFPGSPLSSSQLSVLNISPFEWYDLLARDAISHIQRLNQTSNGDPSWKSFEIALSRKESPVPEGPLSQLERTSGQCEGQQPTVDEQVHPTTDSLSDYDTSTKPWNTKFRIELSRTDLHFFRYYVEVVGPILDLFDPARHFSNVVPHLALRNTGLLKSILAAGAKHMSLTSKPSDEDALAVSNSLAPNGDARPRRTARSPSPDSEIDPTNMATQYYYETLQYLSQTLLYPSYAESHEILATATMISTYEMFDVDGAPNSSVWEQHLKGSFWIQRSQDNDGESVDSLRQAVWWNWLRQDIWAAFQAGRPTITFWRARKPLETLTSDELATRIIYLCGKCVKYAALDKNFPNQEPKQRSEQGDQLLRALDEWHRILPASYQPVRKVESSSSMFLPIWIHPPNHAGAIQMYYFARATVLLNQPTMGGLSAYTQREKQLTESVKQVCGIANSCQQNQPGIAFVSAQALFGVGQFVRSPEVRREILIILKNMLRISGFPARGLVARLKSVWEE